MCLSLLKTDYKVVHFRLYMFCTDGTWTKKIIMLPVLHSFSSSIVRRNLVLNILMSF